MNDLTLKIFIVDNQAIMIDSLVSLLEDLGHEYPINLELQVSKRADDALAVIREFGAPDVVLTGLVMQGSMDGGVFAKHLSEEFPGTSIYVSSIADQDDLDQRFSSTCATFLSKPASRSELMGMVFTELSKQHDLSGLIAFIERKNQLLLNDLCYLTQLQSIQG